MIQGVKGANYGDVLAGITYGWLNSNEALAAQARAGAGRLLITTFRFDDYGRDPYATHLLDALIAYAGGTDIAPRLNLEMSAAPSARPTRPAVLRRRSDSVPYCGNES